MKNSDSFEESLKNFIRPIIADIFAEERRRNQPTEEKKREPEFIGIDEACELLGKARATVYSLVSKRAVPSYKRGKRLYFKKDELLSWIESGRRKTDAELEIEAERHARRKGLGR